MALHHVTRMLLRTPDPLPLLGGSGNETILISGEGEVLGRRVLGRRVQGKVLSGQTAGALPIAPFADPVLPLLAPPISIQ